MSHRISLFAGLLPALLLCTALAIPTASAQDEAPKTETPAAEATTEETPAEGAAAAPAAEEAPAEEAAAAAPAYPLNETEYAFDNMMLMLCAVLVLFMQAGFALVETGLNASNNALNIMFNN
jgi:Amt family ammonium transporter